MDMPDGAPVQVNPGKKRTEIGPRADCPLAVRRHWKAVTLLATQSWSSGTGSDIGVGSSVSFNATTPLNAGVAQLTQEYNISFVASGCCRLLLTAIY